MDNNNYKRQIFIFVSQCVAKNIEGWLKFCISYMIYSQIWLKKKLRRRSIGRSREDGRSKWVRPNRPSPTVSDSRAAEPRGCSAYESHNYYLDAHQFLQIFVHQKKLALELRDCVSWYMDAFLDTGWRRRFAGAQAFQGPGSVWGWAEGRRKARGEVDYRSEFFWSHDVGDFLWLRWLSQEVDYNLLYRFDLHVCSNVSNLDMKSFLP
jgi:hypothetical protein